VALLPETEEAGAHHVAARICAAVAELAVPHAGSPFEYVTVSIGVAVARPTPDQSMVLLLKSADEALYEAKQSGRNRVSGNRREIEFDTLLQTLATS
jgi:diguanylate cyclase (GGDEF)-like protein